MNAENKHLIIPPEHLYFLEKKYKDNPQLPALDLLNIVKEHGTFLPLPKDVAEKVQLTKTF